jgi:hypothetical protein
LLLLFPLLFVIVPQEEDEEVEVLAAIVDL